MIFRERKRSLIWTPPPTIHFEKPLLGAVVSVFVFCSFHFLLLRRMYVSLDHNRTSRAREKEGGEGGCTRLRIRVQITQIRLKPVRKTGSDPKTHLIREVAKKRFFVVARLLKGARGRGAVRPGH